MSNEESSVRVAVRIRPQTPSEIVEGCGICARAGGAAGEGGIALGVERGFTFDFAFEPTSGQQEIYDTCVKRLVDAALDGYNATVLAYGQTGSGKTYTMGSGWEGDGDGDEDKRGIIPRAIRDLFIGADLRAESARAAGQLPPEFSVHAQFIELYNEDIVDLLDPAKDPYAKGALRITEDGCGGVRIVGASCKAIRGAKEALAALRAGALARTTAATNMNSSSSRSHAVFTLMLRQRRMAADQDGEKEDGEAPEQYETLTAKFHFVDLAGSERLKRTGATGDRAKEGISINCGLLALGNVISALGDKSRKVSHVPYRDSKLTRLLQDSLGGNSNTVMIACVSPSDRDFMETLNTLKYANRARNIKNRCVVNQDLTSRTINQLRQEIARLQLELAEYKQGKRIVSENGEEGWSDVAQENTILTAELEALRRRVKAMQGTIEQLSTKNSELLAEKALGAWSPTENSQEVSECSLTQLVQGYVREIEDLRAQLLESNAMYEASRKREGRSRLDSSLHDTASVIDDAKRELYKEKELLARSIGELEFQRKMLSESMTSATDESRLSIDERERAEGESAEDSEPSDQDDSEEDSEEKAQLELSVQLTALSGDIDTKQRLIEELELSQRRLAALRTHYEQRLDTLHHQIKATQDERDKVLASFASQSSPAPEKSKRVREEYERRLAGMSRELKRLQAASREHQRLQRSQQHTATQLHTMRAELADMKRDKVKLVQKMRAESKRHAAAEALRAKEVAQLRKESRKNANLIRSLEAERRLKEQVLRRKQEEVSILRRGHRDKLSNRAAGRLKESSNAAPTWARLHRWLSRSLAARGVLGELEAALERALTAREWAVRDGAAEQLRELQRTIADTQQQIMTLEEENDEGELHQLLAEIKSAECGRYAVQRIAELTLQHGHEAARVTAMLQHTKAALAQLQDTQTHAEQLWRAAGDHNLAVWAGLARVSSGTSTRSVSPVGPDPPPRSSVTAPVSPAASPPDSPFQRNTGRRGSVRLRDLGVVGRDDDMSQSMVDTRSQLQAAPLCRVPSAPGSLRGLIPLGTSMTSSLTSPISPRRAPESPRLLRRQPSLNKPSLETSDTPASPLAARRARDDDVFLRLAGANGSDSGLPKGVIREVPLKRTSGGGSDSGLSLQCTHVAEGHVGAVLSLAASRDELYSGGVDRTVRAWAADGGGESWRAWCGAPVTALAAGRGVILAAAGAAVLVCDVRAAAPVCALWSSGVTGPLTPRGPETAVTSLTVDDVTVYVAAGDKLRLWDLRAMECVGKLWSGHAAAVMCLSLVRDAGRTLLCTGSKDHYVRTVDLQAGGVGEGRRLLQPPHYDGVQALAAVNGALYSASRDSSLKRWSLRSGELAGSVMNAHKGWVTGVASLNERALATCGRDGVLRLWSPTLRPLTTATATTDVLHALAVGPRAVYTAGNGGEVRIWRVLEN